MYDNTDQRLTSWSADYVGFATPVSRGGKGPENAAEVLGIECNHHHGITKHDVVSGEKPADTVYRLVREVWHKPQEDREIKVLEDNHTWEIEETQFYGRFSKVILRKNEKSPLFINILGYAPGSYADGPGAKWFDQEYRVATVGMIAAEIAYCSMQRAEYRAKATRHKDTIRGRKSAKSDRNTADNYERLIRIVVSRYPQLANLVPYADEELVAA